MTTAEIEDQLKDYNVMVHGIRDLKPGQTHKLTWNDTISDEYSMYFDKVDSAEDLVRQVKWQLSLQKIDIKYVDLLINCLGQ